MKIEHQKGFIKNYNKRFGGNAKFKSSFGERVRLFVDNPNHPLLRDHPLKGNKISLRAFSVTGGVRVVYKQIGKRIIFLDIGTHNQVY